MPATITIPRRYRGPLASANGGYASGLLAAATGAPAVEVTLRLPPPLDRPLEVTASEDGWLLRDGTAIVAEARPAEPGLEIPVPPSAAEASRSQGAPGPLAFAECFVCGTRPEHDGLEIHPAPVPGRSDGLVATTWVARDGTPEVVWAAIDCPGAYAVKAGARGEPLLARMTARLVRLPRDGEQCVVTGWPLEQDGRKLHAGTALFGEDGALLAFSRQLWIEPRTG